MKRPNIDWRALVLAAATTAAAAPTLAQPTPPLEPAGGADFTASVEVTRAVVDTKGGLLRELPTSRYRLERFADGRLRMTMLPPPNVPSTGTMGDAFAGITVEANPTSGALDVRDAGGRSLALDGAAPSAWATPGQQPDGLVAPVAEHGSRRAALERQFGKAVGKIRGLDRYVARDGEAVHELLVRPDSSLPAEMNVAQGARLVEHHTFEYTRLGAGAWVRSRVVSETAMPGTPDQRLVAVSTMADVRTKGGAQ